MKKITLLLLTVLCTYQVGFAQSRYTKDSLIVEKLEKKMLLQVKRVYNKLVEVKSSYVDTTKGLKFDFLTDFRSGKVFKHVEVSDQDEMLAGILGVNFSVKCDEVSYLSAEVEEVYEDIGLSIYLSLDSDSKFQINHQRYCEKCTYKTLLEIILYGKIHCTDCDRYVLLLEYKEALSTALKTLNKI